MKSNSEGLVIDGYVRKLAKAGEQRYSAEHSNVLVFGGPPIWPNEKNQQNFYEIRMGGMMGF